VLTIEPTEHTVRLTNKEMEALGVDRNAKSRALKQLQENGLISIQQGHGKIPIVTIIHTD
jgi:DNA-binding GntR family transcriptional regulator